ncbi:hypothetical protein PsorP6_014699 [Peronosclerospora sorghi]|uniref:Uncharacterized protein n=1 Tax=Peronosclerospora sorghi TaxID=230839 RepID=A0ACC0VRF5_9STRA|nr:hypothetical protein PsorP6_014699 [Peronosclerospora sorghi]
MVMRHDDTSSIVQAQRDAAPMLTRVPPKRVLSFKDAVVRPPPSSACAPLSDQPVRSAMPKSRCKSGNDDKPPTAAGRPIRSRSVSKIVESPSFKMRCEALKSHHGRKIDDLKGEHTNPAIRSASGSLKATAETFKKETPLEELCEREKVVQTSNESFKERTRPDEATPSLFSPRGIVNSSSDKDCPRLCVMYEEREQSRAMFDSDTQETSCCSSCDSSPWKMDVNGSLSKAAGHVGTMVGNTANTSQSCSPFPSVSPGQKSEYLDESDLSHELTTGCCSRRHESRKGLDSDDDFLDCDDTNSDSTAESSCASPRHCHFGAYRRCDLNEMETCQEHDELSSMLSNGEDEDEEAYMLLDRINSFSADFVANREYEESNALSWSVQHAAQQGVISTQLQQNLFTNICEGHLEDARDVLYHKCHLVPAVGKVVESPMQSPMDLRALQSFVQYVDDISPKEALEARMHKMQVLKQLSDLLTQWVKMVGRERELSEEHVALTKGSLFLAGSYRLGLDDPSSDIDAVCVTPWHVTHDDFFGSFCHLLDITPGVSHLTPVPNAYVPLISLSYMGVRMDLLFARLPVSSVESNQNIDSDHMLVGVHETSMKALNAPRVCSMLLCLVPKRREYRVVLRAVRAWARRRGIYSSKLGYLGGISWAILVAFVCQLYPDAEPAKIFVRFFQVLSEWQWPQPVMLNLIYDAGLGFDMWDPRQNVFDRSHIMPIITPAYPHMNSSVQVSQSTFSVISEEMWRARYLAEIAVGISKPLSLDSSYSDDLEANSKGAMVCMATSMPSQSTRSEAEDAQHVDGASTWNKLFQPSNFFIRYSSYMVFNFQAASESAMHKWGKFVQSRIRKLVDNLYHIPPVSRVHAFPQYFSHVCNTSYQGPGSCMFIGIEFHYRRHQSVQPKDDPEVKKTLEQTIRFFLATDLQQMEDKQPDMAADANVIGWDELPAFVFPLGRRKATHERAQYLDDMELMGFSPSNTFSLRAPCFANSYNRNGKWRGGGPRKYMGGPRKRRDFRNAPRHFSGLQTG